MSKYGVISGSYFPAVGLNTERYFVSLRIQSECAKIPTKNNFVFGQFSRSEAREKWKLNFSQCVLFHMKTRVRLKYFVNNCMYNISAQINSIFGQFCPKGMFSV